MTIDFVRACCRSFPHVAETVQWENDLVFKVGGKMFAVMPLEPAPVRLSFKCSPEDFAELTERPGIIPAPYLARGAGKRRRHPRRRIEAPIARGLRPGLRQTSQEDARFTAAKNGGIKNYFVEMNLDPMKASVQHLTALKVRPLTLRRRPAWRGWR